MPRVPTARDRGIGEAQVTEPAEQGSTAIRTSAEAFGGGAARQQANSAQAIQQAGRAASELSGMLASRAKQMQDENNTAAAMEAYAEASDRLRTFLHDPQEGVFARQGKQAQGATDEAQELFSEQLRERTSNLQNEAQRKAFRDLWLRRRDSTLNSVARHQAQQFQTYRQNQAEAVTQSSITDAINGYTDPNIVEDAITAAAASIRAGYAGQSEEVVDNRVSAMRSSIRAGITEQVIANHGADRARAYLKKHGDQIDPESRLTLESKIDAAADRERRAAASRLSSRLDDHIASVRATGKGVPGIEDRAQATLKPEQFAEFQRQTKLARQTYKTTQELQFATPQEMATKLDTMRPESGAVDFEDKRQAFQTAQRAARDILSKRAEDPAGYASRMPEIQRAFETEPAESAVGYRMEAQREMGVPEPQVRVLAKDEAQGIVAKLQDEPASKRASRILQMQRDYGRHFDAAFAELVDAGLDPQTSVLASMAGDPALSAQVAQVIETGRDELTKGLDSTTVNDMEARVRDELVDFRQVFEAGDYTGGAAVQANGIIGTAKDLAIHYFRQSGDQDTAVERAVNDVVLDRFEIVNTDQIRAYVPRVLQGQAIDTGKVETVAEMNRKRDMIEAFDPVPIEDPAAGDMLNRERTIRTAVNSGYWVTNETGDGLVLMVPFEGGGALPLTNAQGERYEVGFTEASSADIAPENIGGIFRPPREIGSETGILRGTP